MVTLDQLNTAIGAADSSADAATAAATTATAEAIEAQDKRIDILSLAGDSSNSHIISANGSYYLSDNITGVSGRNGIRVAAQNVTIDLNGFSVIGVAGSLDGIFLFAAATPNTIVIKNGTVRNWGGNGIATNTIGFFGEGTLYNVNLLANTSAGFSNSFGARWSFYNCVARSNGLGGFNTGGGVSVLENCEALNNTSNGFTVSNASILKNCVARSNTSHGFSGSGIMTNCIATGNSLDGFNLLGGRATDCTSTQNGSDGFQMIFNCAVIRCTAQGNGTAGTGAGVYATQADNLIQGNLLLGNDNGVDCDLTGNVVIGNVASGNTDDYGQVVAGNHLGTVHTTPAAMNGATNNFANVSF